MSLLVHSIENPNIMEHPQLHGPIIKFGRNTQTCTTVGDLHGNALYFIYIAVLRGAMQITPENYRKLADLYNSWSSTDAEMVEYKRLLATIAVAPGTHIRLIGDELADRGMDDSLMLEALAHFTKGGGITETILSNHTAGFITAIERAIKMATDPQGTIDHETFKAEFLDYKPYLLENQPKAAASFANLQYCVQNGAMPTQHLLELYESHRKTFRAFLYDYAIGEQNNKINLELTFYSHAPVSALMMVAVADEVQRDFTPERRVELYRITQKDRYTDSDLIPFIDAITDVTQKKAEGNALSSILYRDDTLKNVTLLYDAIENRDNPNQDLNNVHGHQLNTFGSRTTLDSVAGRTDYRLAWLDEAAAELHCKNDDLLKLKYIVSFPWKTPPTEEELNQAMNMEKEPALGPEYDHCRYVPKNDMGQPLMNMTFIRMLQQKQGKKKKLEEKLEDKNPVIEILSSPWEREQGTLIYGYTKNEPIPISVIAARTLLEWIGTFSNGLIDLCTFNWAPEEDTRWRVATFPFRVIGDALRFPLAIASGAIGLATGFVTALYSFPAYPSMSLTAGLSDGLRPFAPKAADWIMLKSVQTHEDYYNATEQVQQRLSEHLKSTWSTPYLGALAVSLSLVTSIIVVSAATGGGMGLGMIMPFIFKDVLGLGGLLTPMLQPISHAFGAAWPYLAGTMFVGGLSSLLSGIVNAVSWGLQKNKVESTQEASDPNSTVSSSLSTSLITASSSIIASTIVYISDDLEPPQDRDKAPLLMSQNTPPSNNQNSNNNLDITY